VRILVAYMSQTGNTKKVAEPIYEEITVDKGIKEKDHEDLQERLERCKQPATNADIVSI